MSTVYVLNKDGKPLMPTTRGGHVRHLLKEQKARVVRAKPFTIQLLYETNDVVQPLYLGIDPGRTNIGVAVVKANGTAVFTAHLETRNKEVPKLMQDRKKARRARRTNGRRCRRQRRAKANGTISKKCVKQTTAQNGSVSKRAKEIGVIKRHLPGCEKDVLCIGIKNKEAKFNNRTRPTGWLTPTANQLLQTHINLVKKIQKVMQIFGEKNVIPTGIKHGTVTVLIGNDNYEVTTYRIDGMYSDGRRPDNVEFTQNLIEDLSRRDFSINAMAYKMKAEKAHGFNRGMKGR